MSVMKKIISILLFALTSVYANAQMEFIGELKEVKGGTLGNLESMYMEGKWWTDMDGQDAAIIKIKIQGMSVAEMKKLEFQGSAGIGLGKKKILEVEQEWWIAVAAGRSDQYIKVSSETFGLSNRLSIEKPLKEKTFYEVVLDNKRLANVSITTVPDGVTVIVDGDNKGKTPIEISNQRYGKHHLKLLYDGMSKEDDIDVEEGHTMFKYDMQRYHYVNINTDPDGSAVFVDGQMIGKSPILGYKILVGSHKFRAEYSATQVDEQNLEITENTTNVTLKPIKKSNVRIMTHYSGRPICANLVVDNSQSFNGKEQYIMTLPYGNHNFRVSYNGKSKEKSFNISKPEFVQTIKLSAKNDFVWPWEREYNHKVGGFSIGYVQKQVLASNDSEKLYCDPAYFRDGESLSGIQIGFHLQPCFSWGGGFYTGLFYEMYFASDSSFGDDIKNFSEHNLNIPAHLYYRIPFSRNFSIALHGGVSFDVGLYACYSKNFLGVSSDNESSQIYDDYYGNSNSGPNRFQINWDLAASINISRIGINAYMSRGMLDNSGLHDMIDGADKIKVNKFGISISYLIGEDD